MSSPFSPVCDGCGARLLEPVGKRCPFCGHRHAGQIAFVRWAKALAPWILIFVVGGALACAISLFERSLEEETQRAAEEHRYLEERRATKEAERPNR